MIGAIAIIVAMLAFPIGLFLSGAAVAAVHGWLHTRDGEVRYAGSELLLLRDGVDLRSGAALAPTAQHSQ